MFFCPRSLLFQPKWKGGSLLGNKNWGSSWKQMGANSNFYRPGYGYGYSAGGGSMLGPMLYPQQAGFNYGQANYGSNEQLVVNLPGTSAPGYSPVLLTHPGSSGAGAGANDGWTVPAQHQITNSVSYDSGYQAHPGTLVRQPTIDPYGSVKGGNNRISSSGTTKK